MDPGNSDWNLMKIWGKEASGINEMWLRAAWTIRLFTEIKNWSVFVVLRWIIWKYPEGRVRKKHTSLKNYKSTHLNEIMWDGQPVLAQNSSNIFHHLSSPRKYWREKRWKIQNITLCTAVPSVPSSFLPTSILDWTRHSFSPWPLEQNIVLLELLIDKDFCDSYYWTDCIPLL